MDRLKAMETFVRIVESGSLSAAAQQMSTTQPTVSRRLQTLERALGLRLAQELRALGVAVVGLERERGRRRIGSAREERTKEAAVHDVALDEHRGALHEVRAALALHPLRRQLERADPHRLALREQSARLGLVRARADRADHEHHHAEVHDVPAIAAPVAIDEVQEGGEGALARDAAAGGGAADELAGDRDRDEGADPSGRDAR